MWNLRSANLARLLGAWLVATPVIGLADQVVLNNGDRLSGKIVSLTDSKLVVKTEYAGVIRIALIRIVSLQTDVEMTIVRKDESRQFGRLTGDGKQLYVDDGTIPVPTVMFDQISTLMRGHVSGDEWKSTGQLSLGAADNHGNTTNRNVNVAAELITRNARNRFTVGGIGNYAANADQETESNALLYTQYDRFFSRLWYGNINASFANDKFTDIYLRSTLGLGAGYQIYDNKQTSLQVNAGLNYVQTDFYVAPTESYPGLRLATRYAHWFWEDLMQFFFDGSVTVSLRNNQDAFARVSTGVRFPLRDGFLASLQYLIAWENNPAPDQVALDRTLVVGVGYKW